MIKTRYIVSAIIQDGDKILLGKKAKGQPPYPDVWHLPGGGIDDQILGKNLWDTQDYDNPYLHYEVQREITEEVGIKVKNICSIVPGLIPKPAEDRAQNKHGELTHYFFLVYTCDFDSGVIHPASDLAELKWIEKDNLKNIALTPPSLQLFTELKWL